MVGNGGKIAGQKVGFQHAKDLLGGGFGRIKAGDVLVVAGVHVRVAHGPTHGRRQHDGRGGGDAHHDQQRVAGGGGALGGKTGLHAQLGQCEAALSWMR